MSVDKFKVWDNDEKIFLDKPVLIDEDGDVFGLAYSSQIVHYDGDLKIVHSTGLLDKNGTEIYEGDYVKCKWGHSDWSGAVEFIEGMFCSSPENPEKHPSAISECHDVEVMGNIYEHPHLLSGDTH